MEERPYLERVHVRGFRCLLDVQLRLTRLHALVGPNDSGKSTLLTAISRVESTVQDQLVSRGGRGRATVSLQIAGGSGELGPFNISDPGDSAQSYPIRGKPEIQNDALDRIVRALDRSRRLELDPEHLRRPSKLIPHNQPITFFDPRGTGLGAVYDAVFSRHKREVLAIEDDFRTKFPTVASLEVRNVSDTEKSIAVRLVNGTLVEPAQMSEGMLYWLAFAALRYLDPVGILLIEEPENGLHPHRIREVMRVLRELSQTTQVILATHSPLILNELQPEEISIVTRHPERGTQVKRLDETTAFARRSKAYQNGELWLAYANGEDERELVGDPE
jgi:predicted ATPase